ncbi:MAG: hypothetical protein KF753_18300 [Caldilineaceae bacterium]|nr:hypothetical protein [Caldilineaceae bacterium]
MSSQLERQLAEAQQALTDLLALVAGESEKIEQLRTVAAQSLAEADLATLPAVAAKQAKAEIELAASRKVRAELQRRADQKRETVAHIEKAIRQAHLVKLIEAAQADAEDIWKELIKPLAQRALALQEAQHNISALDGPIVSFYPAILYDALEVVTEGGEDYDTSLAQHAQGATEVVKMM